MDYCSLMSGSWGNCHYIKAGDTQILIDAGQSGKRILGNLALAGLGDGRDLQGILVTHAHRDHVIGVGILARKLKLPVYATEGTWFEMKALAGEIPQGLHRCIGTEDQWQIGALSLESFPTSHDALESVGFVLRHEGASLGVATDCGVFTHQMERCLRNLQGLVLEANHDLNMLRCGAYPEHLKKRIAGVEGHLSNEEAAEGLQRIIGPESRHVVLAHLSQENNRPGVALQAMREILQESRVVAGADQLQVASEMGTMAGRPKEMEWAGLRISVAPRCIPGEKVSL